MICHYTCGIKLIILSVFVCICDNLFQCLILRGLYNVSCVNCVYHVSSVIDTIPFKFRVKIGVELGYEKGRLFALPCPYSTIFKLSISFCFVLGKT